MVDGGLRPSPPALPVSEMVRTSISGVSSVSVAMNALAETAVHIGADLVPDGLSAPADQPVAAVSTRDTMVE